MFKLLRYYTGASAVAILVVTAVIIGLARQASERSLIQLAERENTDIAQTLINGTQDRLFSYLAYTHDKTPDQLRASAAAQELDETLHTLVKGLHVSKIKLYRLSGLTVYSSVPAEIGKDKSDYHGFQQVLATNGPVSQLTFRGEFSAMERTLFDRSMVASYLPLRGRDNGIAGVLEIYTDVSDIIADLERQNIRTVVTIGAVSGTLWLILFLIVRRGDGLLRHQYAVLEGEVEERRHAQEELRKLAGTDPLTGIANRRRFTELSEQELRHAYRYGHPVSVLMIDLDEFKNINDTHGHAVGDTVLKDAADAICRSMRNTDIIGRLGGDEFSVLLVEADIATAEFVANRIRVTLQEMAFSAVDGPVEVRTSIGGAHARPDEPLEALMKRADEALYEAKSAGRNTVMFDQGQAADAMPA